MKFAEHMHDNFSLDSQRIVLSNTIVHVKTSFFSTLFDIRRGVSHLLEMRVYSTLGVYMHHKSMKALYVYENTHISKFY